MRPRPSGSSAGPRRRSRTRPLPSRAERKPWISSGPASVGRSSAPAGRVHDPPRRWRNERSARRATRDGRWVRALSRPRAWVSSSRASTARVPWPGAGVNVSGSSGTAASGQAEAEQAGGGQDDRLQLAGVDPADPAVDVAADRHQLQVGPEPVQQGDPAGAAGPDPGPGRQVVEGGEAVAADEHVARVVAPGHGGQDQAGDLGGGQVLGRVHGQVGPAVQDRLLHGRGEDALAAERGRRDVAAPVALGDDRDQLDPQLRPGRPQPVDHQPALGERERAPPRGQAQGPVRPGPAAGPPEPGQRSSSLAWGSRPYSSRRAAT